MGRIATLVCIDGVGTLGKDERGSFRYAFDEWELEPLVPPKDKAFERFMELTLKPVLEKV